MTTTTSRTARLLRIVGQPVRGEAREMLARNWATLPPAMRVPQQMFGRQGNGCGATIGAMPRCDFACRGCYLSADANRIPADSVEAIKGQMRAMRPVLGHAGNLQLTDGEVTLRPVAEVVELLRYAQSIDLIPMLMTHGDTFRRRPGLLEQLMVEGGLVEVSIHIDTTQRGRMGDAYKHATSEHVLHPLREEFAGMIRRARATTGLPLRAATTMTVTRENLGGVRSVVEWLSHNADAFRLVSFQPIAQVGRTESGFGGGVDVAELWERIAEGLGVSGGSARMERLGVWFGHEACNRMVHGLIVTAPGGGTSFHALRDADDAVDVRVIDGFLARFGGSTFRLDSPAEALARMAGITLRAPGFVLRNLLPYAAHWARRVGGGSVLRGALRLAKAPKAVQPLVIVSHHFMSGEEMQTPLGQERLSHCIFHVPIEGRMVSMCEVNATGIREEYYAALSRSGADARTAHSPGDVVGAEATAEGTAEGTSHASSHATAVADAD